MGGNQLGHRIIIGALIWDAPQALDDMELKSIMARFAGASMGSRDFPSDLDAAIMVEGRHTVKARKLGIVSVCKTNAIAFQHSIQEMKAVGRQQLMSPSKPAISLSIGSSLFGAAHLAFWAMSLPNSAKGSAVQIIEALDSFRHGELAWLDTDDSENVYRDDIDRLSVRVLN